MYVISIQIQNYFVLCFLESCQRKNENKARNSRGNRKMERTKKKVRILTTGRYMYNIDNIILHFSEALHWPFNV